MHDTCLREAKVKSKCAFQTEKYYSLKAKDLLRERIWVFKINESKQRAQEQVIQAKTIAPVGKNKNEDTEERSAVPAGPFHEHVFACHKYQGPNS